MDVSDARWLKTLEDENARLKKLLAERMLDNAVISEVAAKNKVRPVGARISFVLTFSVCINATGLSRVGRCCGQANRQC